MPPRRKGTVTLMSKQPSNQAKRNLLRRGLAGILSLALILGLLPGSVVSAAAASWADPYVETLVDWGVMRGDIGGNMAPDRSITRAEFVAMMNRAYGYTKLGGHPFTDVRTRDWYNEDIDIGYNIGYFKGTSPTTASPNDTLTREQAAVLLARNMMLQETVGETLGFSDSRSLSDWSRGLVGAAAANGIISGYDDGTFQPFRNITRGEVAAMLVRAIGTPIQTEGEHALGNVYGNVTVNTSGVKLRDGVIVGNLYLTGGIDLGDVLLENVTVLGEIIVSGGGESNSSAASIVMRNVTADNLIVDSIADQFVTIRAEGVTDIPTTTVRTNAYVDDSSLPGYGLSYIELDGDEGTLLQLAGNVKEVWNKTPGSDLQVVQGSAEKITIDEDAVGSSVLVDGDARVDELNLDTATTVTGTGDIKNLNVGAAGSTVEQLPDNITIRPGISADINGSDMNSTQAAESSADPRLLAGYPAVKNIAPNSATLVFRTNKTGTIYWAISAVADGSVSEADLMEPPVYGGNVLQSGTISATSANTDFTAAVTGLTKDGSYYVTAMLVDGRDQHSPIKVTSFSTPDDTVPAFNQGYPYMSRITTENSQVTVSTNKSCLLYYALLPKGSTAPTPAEFKANAITGNLGYGTIDTVKNVTQPFQVNSTRLKELTDYTLYLWLTDYDGAKSSAVISLDFTTPDEQPPVIVEATPAPVSENSAQLTFSLNEAGTLYWAVVPEGRTPESLFEGIDEEDWKPANVADNIADPNDRRLQIKTENGAGNAILKGSQAVRAGYTNAIAQVRNLDTATYGSSFTMYIVAKDAAGNYSKVQKLTIRVKDTTPPTVTLQFDPENESNPKQPSVTATAQLVFSERVRGSSQADNFETLYNEVTKYENDPINKASAMNAWAAAVSKYIKLYYGPVGNNNGSAADDRRPVEPVATECRYDETNRTFVYGARGTGSEVVDNGWLINYCEARLTTDRDNHMIIEFPAYDETSGTGALKLTSGTQYHFTVSDVVDLSEESNMLKPNPTRQGLDFTTQAAQVLLTRHDEPKIEKADQMGSGDPDKNDPARIDFNFWMRPQDVEQSDESLYWDMLIWFDANVSFTLYSRPIDADGTPLGNGEWHLEGNMSVGKDSFQSLKANIPQKVTDPTYDKVNTMLSGDPAKERKEYAVHIDRLEGNPDKTGWNFEKVTMRVSVVAGDRTQVRQVLNGGYQDSYDNALANGLSSIETLSPFTISQEFTDRGQPEIKDTPTISIQDDGAKVTLQMTKRGSLYYLAIPLSRLNINGVEQDAKELTETIIKDVNSYFCPLTFLKKETDTAKPQLVTVPLMEGDPDKAIYQDTTVTPRPLDEMEVEKPDHTDFTRGGELGNGIIRDKTPTSASETSYLTIDLSKRLKANTTYLLCLLPCGVSAVPNDESRVWAYRFTTHMEDIPTLQLLGGRNPTIEAQVDETAYIDYFLVPYDTEKDKAPLGNKFRDLVADKNWYDTTYRPQDTTINKANMTVLEAMADYRYDGTTFIGTAFDLYAQEELKSPYVQYVRSMSSSGGNNDGVLACEQGKQPVSGLTMNFGEAIGARRDDYVVVAMARRNENSDHYAFCAWYKVHKQATNPPMIQSAYVSNFKSETDKTTNITTLSGTLTLQFNGSLYYYKGSNDYLPYDNCRPGVHAADKLETDGHYPLGVTVSGEGSVLEFVGAADATTATHTDIDRISIKVTKLQVGSRDTIGFGTIIGEGGADNGRGALSVTIRAVNSGTADAPEYNLTATIGGNVALWTLTGWDSGLN